MRSSISMSLSSRTRLFASKLSDSPNAFCDTVPPKSRTCVSTMKCLSFIPMTSSVSRRWISRVRRISSPIDPVGQPFVTAAQYITDVGVVDVQVVICAHTIIHDTVMIMLRGILQNLLTDERRRWAVLVVVCFGQFMIVLDTTIVNV